MEERKFTKDRPCSKVEIWNAFYGEGSSVHPQGGRSTDIVRARSIIGRFVPNVLVNEGRARLTTVRGEEHLVLTIPGEVWLREGITRYIRNNPERADEVENPPVRRRRRKV